MRPGDFPAPPDGGGGGRRRGVNGVAGAPLQPPAARRRSSGSRAAPCAGASSADSGAGAPQRQQLPRRRLGLPAVAVGGSGGGRAARSLAGARLEAGAAASRPRGGRKGGAGPGPWAPQDARTEPAPGTSNDKPPVRPAPRRTSSGRGTAGASKTRPGATARDQPLQPPRAHRGPAGKPGLEFSPLRLSRPPWESGERKGKVLDPSVGTGSVWGGWRGAGERKAQVRPGADYAGREVKERPRAQRGER